MYENATIQIQALLCQECHRPWLDAHERWRVYVDDDVQVGAVPYCPDCAHREFDGD